MAFYTFTQRFPQHARKLLISKVKEQVGPNVETDPHFTPTYDPWDQRVCLVPDGDLFITLREGRATVVTDVIDTFTATGIRLQSGRELAADIIVTATGLRLQFLGGVTIEIDGRRIEPSTLMTYKGMMCSDLPNFALVVGYTNASWTLRGDLTCKHVCRLLNYMDERRFTVCVPRRDPSVKEEPLLGLTAGYVQRAIAEFPRQGDRAPWKVHQNYALDRLGLRLASIDDGSLIFSKG
jgi:cation diffusion facilitator CzcD-associated flavoprotein CzcO